MRSRTHIIRHNKYNANPTDANILNRQLIGLLYTHVCTVTDFGHATLSKWPKSAPPSLPYGIFGSENTYLCTVTTLFLLQCLKI